MSHHDGPGVLDPTLTLRELEAMIVGVGGENPAALLQTVQHQRASAHTAARVAASKTTTTKDCLAVDSNPQVALTRRAQARSITATPSMMKGASMAGKDRPEKRYIGKGFQPPPAESPGPIYSPPAGFAEEAVMGNCGYSFPRANRSMKAHPNAQTPGPNSYSVASTIGAQVVSTSSTASAAVFPSANRFNDKIFISAAHSKGMHATDAPGPSAYFANTSKIPMPGARAPSALLLSSKESDRKCFISKAHVVDAMGSATTKADYPAAASLDAAHPKGPAFSFGTGTRGAGPVTQPTVHTIDSPSGDPNASVGSTGQRRVVVRPPQQPTPGPGQYVPNMDAAYPSAPMVGIPVAPREDKRFWSKQLSTQLGADSPGICYEPRFSAKDPHAAAATFAGRSTAEGANAERFNDKIFIGKAFNGGLGAASPGPAYALPGLEHGPAYTMAHKEKHFPKTVFPGPSRPRWISRESAKDNMGAYSPGPKYNTGTDIAKQGLAYSFGSAPRSSGSALGAAAQQHGGSSAQPSPSLTDTAPNAGGQSARISGAKISPVRTTERRVSPVDEAMRERAASALPVEPKYVLTEPKSSAFSFSGAERFGAKAIAHVHTVSPGPVYTPQFQLTEHRVPGGSFGGLP